MAQEYKNIQLELGDTSLSTELGIYYIDFTDSLVHYESDFYGDKDENGIPMVGKGKNASYNPINLAQYGLLLHALWIKTKEESYLQKMKLCVAILWKLMIEDEYYCVWRYNYESSRHSLSKGWPSAMAQGQCISLFLRFYQIVHDEKYLVASQKAFQFLLEVTTDKGGARNYDKEGNLWLEEYPTPNEKGGPSCVLNGFIYALWGLYDLYRVTKNPIVKQEIDACVLTLKNTLHKFDVGYWSLYDCYTKELVRYYYQKNVHTPQLEVMYHLTNEPLFGQYARKWKKTVNPINFAFVQLMYRIRPRLMRLGLIK